MAKSATDKLIDAAEYALIQLRTMHGMYAAELDAERRTQLGAKSKSVEFQIDNKRYIKMLERALAGMEKGAGTRPAPRSRKKRS